MHRRARTLIDERGLRYEWVATQLTLSKDRFAHILDGRRPVPKPETQFYAKLAELLHVTPSEVCESDCEAAA